jgi:ComF family protein
MKSLNAFFDFFIPRYCPACKTKLNPDQICMCEECLASIERAESSRLNSEYQRKFVSTDIISGFTSLFVFEKDKALQLFIHSIKYNKRFLNAKYLGKLIGKNLKEQINNWNVDIIVPVPLHSLRKVDRGFNQSKYIANGIGKELGIDVKSHLLKRIRYTETQTNLTLKEREKNIMNAFRAKHRGMIDGKTFLIVDDIITTGATIRECGRVLLEYGAEKVFACSAAIAD